jgi:hypothetical protein
MHEVAIEIGGNPIRLRSTDPKFLSTLERRYAGFWRPSENTGALLNIELQAPQTTRDEDVQVSVQTGEWHIRRGDFYAVWNHRQRTGTVLQQASPYALDSALRIIHSLLLTDQDGFLIHAASVIRGGKAFFFAGPSGAGKTTLTRMAPADSTVLTDEISYIRSEGDGYHACGTPFSGELGEPGQNTRAPLAGWFILAQGDENRLEHFSSRADALRLLMQNILFFAREPEITARVFNAACRFVTRIPGQRLVFRREPAAWELVK